MKALSTFIAVLSIIIGFLSLQIFFSFAHTQLTPDIACSEAVANSVSSEIKEEYLVQCEKVQENVVNGMNIALDYSVVIGILSFVVLLSSFGAYFISKQRGNFNA